jgi:hypothetical protein
MPELIYAGALTLSGSSLNTVDISKISIINGSVTVSTAANLGSLNIPSLKYIAGSLSIGGTAISTQTTNIKTLDAPSLLFLGSLIINYSPLLSGVNLPSIQVINGSISSSAPFNTSLVNFNLGSGLYHMNGNITCTGQKISSSSIENILVRLSNLTGSNGTILYGTSKSVNLSGGTSAGLSSLSATALSARTTLVNRGVTVTLNA